MSLWRAAWVDCTVGPLDREVLEDWVPAISGQKDWLAERMDVVGIMEGSVDEIVDHFRWLVAAAPTLRGLVHLSPAYTDVGVERTLSIGMGAVVCGEAAMQVMRPQTLAEKDARWTYDWDTGFQGDAMRSSRPS